MLVKDQKIKIKWNKQNREHYESLGYVFTGIGDEFYVSPEDLTDGSHVIVDVDCDYCGRTVHVHWKDYKKSKGNKYSCQSCRQIKTCENTLKERQEYLYSSALEFCNEMGYELITPKDKIINANSRVIYRCPLHGEHETKIYTLITRHGCIDCGNIKTGLDSRLSQEEVNGRIEACGGIWINKDEYVGWATKNLEIICQMCHNPFKTSLNSYTKRGGQFCPCCASNESIGEKKIRLFLDTSHISYVQEYRFCDCRDKNSLPFDFYISDFNMVIEFQGAQHYDPVLLYGGDDGFKLRKKHDEIKKDYCAKNNIKLIEIPYWNMNNIEQILRENLIA